MDCGRPATAEILGLSLLWESYFTSPPPSTTQLHFTLATHAATRLAVAEDLLAFYNICAEYKKAIFQVSAPTSYIDERFQGKKTKKELTALFSSYEVRKASK